MNWQQLSIISCLLWVITGILLSQATKTQPGLAVTICYGGAVFGCALVIGLFRRQSVDFGQGAIYLALVAGVCSSIAIFAQMISLNKSPAEYPWIFLIGSLNPVVSIVFAMYRGERPSGLRCLGMLCVFAGLVLIARPSKKETLQIKQLQRVHATTERL